MSTQRFERLQRESLLDAKLPAENPPVEQVKAARIRFAPGQPTGLHSHPISTTGIVTEGSFTFQLEGEAAKVLQEGDCFFEPAGRTVLHFDNASPTEPAEIVCFYLMGKTDTQLIEMHEGGLASQLGVAG